MAQVDSESIYEITTPSVAKRTADILRAEWRGNIYDCNIHNLSLCDFGKCRA